WVSSPTFSISPLRTAIAAPFDPRRLRSQTGPRVQRPVAKHTDSARPKLVRIGRIAGRPGADGQRSRTGKRGTAGHSAKVWDFACLAEGQKNNPSKRPASQGVSKLGI